MSQPAMTVEIDEAIRRDPELLRDVEAATAYLDTLHLRGEPPAAAHWRLAQGHSARPDHRPAVVLSLVDQPDDDSIRVESAPLDRARTRGEGLRDQAMRRLWTALLQSRSRILHRRVTLAISRIESEGDDGD